ncbi:choice-of-anchor Q domain-containing protein [Pontiella agarivorans]|uniref:Choice-of-anchor Q domain-containing protein n=1 Tax=Pontiella agarivorans TaxID=3038953 RepID=A0ABU5MXJ1_9BACT|nr:choice-of-anchor Q domain-containing protein [Pontiella agarivorans]MDZ8118941.1 choice-of-anchor Q domain-containing protein [Pontiella agarivorans]
MKSAALGLSLLITAASTMAATYYVSLTGSDTAPYSDWGTAATKIQTAVDAASDGDTVLVNSGTYNLGYTVTPGYSMPNRVVITKDITVQSLGGAANTFIAGNNILLGRNDVLVRCVYMTKGELIGFTLQNGHANTTDGDTAYDQSGGGINLLSGNGGASGSGIVSNCIIKNCTATYSGGGSYGGQLVNCEFIGNATDNQGGGSCSSTLQNCTLTSNTANNGGGSSVGSLTDCSLTGNEALSLGGGSHFGVLSNCTFSGNQADSGGGSHHSTLSACTLSNNTARHGGGCRSATLNDCLITGNVATNGGGAYQSDLTNCTLSQNTAGSGGGTSSSTLEKCTIKNNIATGSGGGNSNSTLTDCVLDGNRADRGAGVYGGTLTDCTLTENVATTHGGGSAYATLTGCTLIGNDGGGSGGGSYFDTLSRCTLSGNTASKGGGAYDGTIHNAVFIDNTAIWGGGTYDSELHHCTLKGNSAVNDGGGCSKGHIYNSIIVDNLADTNEDGNGSGDDLSQMDTVLACCTSVLEAGQTGTTNAPDFEYLSLRLQPDSPCIDAAVTQSGAIMTDIDGLPRWLDGNGDGSAIADMGAYEFAGAGDYDDDGLTDAEEVAFGSGVNNTDSDGDGREDGDEAAMGFCPTFDESAAIAQGEANVTDDPAAHGLYTADSIQDLNLGNLMLQTSGNMLELSLQLKQTDNLASNVWNEVGDAVEWEIPATNGAAFFRVHAD